MAAGVSAPLPAKDLSYAISATGTAPTVHLQHNSHLKQRPQSSPYLLDLPKPAVSLRLPLKLPRYIAYRKRKEGEIDKAVTRLRRDAGARRVRGAVPLLGRVGCGVKRRRRRDRQ
jgi:hypothetical protein